MVSSMYYSLLIYLCNVDSYSFAMKVKDINSVNTYSSKPSLGYEAYYLIQISSLILIFRFSNF